MHIDWSLGETFVEIAKAYSKALLAVAGPIAVWTTIAFVLTSSRAVAWYATTSRPFRRLVGVLLLGGAIGWAWHLASMFDDTYISLRYADNLVNGHGLVFNLGERVEGYTNFLWTVLLAGGMAAGIDGTRVALVGCFAWFVLELLLVVRIARLLSPEQARPQLPLAAIALGASYTFATFGTSGMETMFAALLMTLALERALVGSYGLAGLSGILSTMAHPDHALLYAGLGAAIVIDPKARKSLWKYALPFAVVYVPYFTWRWRYYGDLFPNTYYAKSASLTYFSQGAVYLAASGLSSGLFLMLPAAAHALWRRRRSLMTAYTVLGAGPYLIYVAKIGGDFMLGRLVVSILPLFALLAERGLRDMIEEGLRAPVLLATVLFGVTAAPVRLLADQEKRWFLTDERTWYPVMAFWPEVAIDSRSGDRALALRDISEHGGRPLVAEPTIGLEGYLSELPMIDLLGLTDRVVAHQPLQSRGRPGHEKLATVEYLRSRGVDLSFVRLTPPQYSEYAFVTLRGRPFFLGRYKPELVEVLRKIPGARVPDMPALMDEYLRVAAGHHPASLAEDLRFFDDFYFSVNRDPVRREALAALAAGEPPSQQTAGPGHP